jgi:hypothetical protein
MNHARIAALLAGLWAGMVLAVGLIGAPAGFAVPCAVKVSMLMRSWIAMPRGAGTCEGDRPSSTRLAPAAMRS